MLFRSNVRTGVEEGFEKSLDRPCRKCATVVPAVLMISPKGGIGPTTPSDPLRL